MSCDAMVVLDRYSQAVLEHYHSKNTAQCICWAGKYKQSVMGLASSLMHLLKMHVLVTCLDTLRMRN